MLGLDFGGKRIGIAISDSAGEFAFPNGCLERSVHARDLAALRDLIAERGVTRVVMGLPLHMDGRSGPEAKAASAFARDLAEATGLEVDMLDERWSSVEAERVLRDAPKRVRKRRGTVDAMAATLILRTYLERTQAAKVGDSR